MNKQPLVKPIKPFIMKKNLYLKASLFGLILLTSFLFLQCSNDKLVPVSKKPNILVILADDLGYGDIQSLNPDSKIPTPILNKLASEGMQFTNAHAPAAVCTPTRYSLLTGRYSWRSDRKKGVTWVWEGPMIEKGQYTIAEMLHHQNYATACVGKWHLGMDWPTTDGLSATMQNEGRNVDYDQPIKNGPIDLGFDYYFGQEVPSFPPHAFIENDHMLIKPTEWLENKEMMGVSGSPPPGIPGAMAPGWRYEDMMYKITDKAIDFIKKHTQNTPDKPFFLYYAMSAPHTPIAPHENFQGKTEVGRYGDYVYEMDYHVGKILNLLDSLDIAENTLVIFSSDNGGVNADGLKYNSKIGDLITNYGHDSNKGLRGMKSDAWEGGHRIPFIVRWPGHVQAGSTSNALISQVDFMATFAAITGAKLPESVAEDSYNMLPLFEGRTPHVRDALVTQSGEGILSIQKNDWKLVLSSGGGGKWNGKGELPYLEIIEGQKIWKNVQLYNTASDISENDNLAGKNPEKLTELIALLKDYIVDGRSTAGKPIYNEKNTLWEEVEWVKQVD